MTSITLRNVQDKLGTRFLGVSLTPGGDVVIEGQDIGDGVEAAFGAGFREYEWAYFVVQGDIAALLHALGAQTDILTALGQRFSDEQASELQPFLDGHAIPYQFWSRMGD